MGWLEFLIVMVLILTLIAAIPSKADRVKFKRKVRPGGLPNLAEKLI